MKYLTKRWRGLGIILAVVVVATAVLSACGSKSNSSSTSTTGAAPVAGGTYNYALASEPVAIDPLNAQESEGVQVAHQVFEGLAKYVLQPDGSMKTEPNIAESWSSTDAKVWTIKIKSNVMFQAPVSRAVTAQDFVDDWNYVTDPKLQSITTYIMNPIEGTDDSGYRTGATLTGVKAIDATTLQVTLKYPFGEFPVTLGHPITAVFPLDYVNKVGQKAFAEKPVGTGPFVVDTWVHNQYIDVSKNPTWWQKSDTNGPFVDKIHFPIITDTNTMWLEFQSGTIDYTDVPPGQVAASENMAQVKSGQWTAKKWPNLGLYYVGINWRDPVLGGAAGLPLRQALSYSVDRNAVINVVNEGVPLVPNGTVPVGIPGNNLSTLPYPYDVAKAKDLVSKMGTVPTLQYWFNTDLGHQKIAEALQAGWKSVGINVNLSNFEWGTFLSKLQAAKGSQLWRLGWLADYPSMDNFLFPLFQTAQSAVNTYTAYSNKNVDQLLQQARGTTDETQRLNLYAQAEKLVLADAPIIPLYFYRDYRVTNNRVKGYYHDPLGLTDMWKVWIGQ
jgi:oligopeptide transport system substrate-binding protein